VIDEAALAVIAASVAVLHTGAGGVGGFDPERPFPQIVGSVRGLRRAWSSTFGLIKHRPLLPPASGTAAQEDCCGFSLSLDIELGFTPRLSW
jgi:hypothetical protein